MIEQSSCDQTPETVESLHWARRLGIVIELRALASTPRLSRDDD